jgi:hypothetical protein
VMRMHSASPQGIASHDASETFAGRVSPLDNQEGATSRPCLVAHIIGPFSLRTQTLVAGGASGVAPDNWCAIW